MNKYIVQHRRGTLEQWAAKDTIIPKEGELVIEIDEENSLHKLKIGDGIHTYAELAYLQAGDDIITQVLTQIKPRIVTIELTTNWIQVSERRYSQEIALENITQNSRLDLQPNADMIEEFKQLGLVFVTENNGGVITIYSVGNMPLKSYTMQATIIETECNEEDAVIGIPVGVPTDGKSAYEYAQEGGYTGTEEEFTQALGKIGDNTSVEVNSWSMVQQLVRLGIAPKVFNIGDQLVCDHEYYGTLVWDIIGIDHDIPVNSEYTHSLTLQLHDCLNGVNIPFDGIESNNPNEDRANYGSNNWTESNIRQWLNSDGDKDWWQPTTEYDSLASSYNSGQGFINGLDAEFLSAIGEVFKTTARNTITDGGGSDTNAEKFFLLSRTEVYGGVNGDIAEGEPYPYYADNSVLSAPGGDEDENRIKYVDMWYGAQNWWLRSPAIGYGHAVIRVNRTGGLAGVYANASCLVAPACCIV